MSQKVHNFFFDFQSFLKLYGNLMNSSILSVLHTVPVQQEQKYTTFANFFFFILEIFLIS